MRRPAPQIKHKDTVSPAEWASEVAACAEECRLMAGCVTFISTLGAPRCPQTEMPPPHRARARARTRPCAPRTPHSPSCTANG